MIQVHESRLNKFLGVYSGRIHGDVELGRVWRPQVIDEILGAHAG